MSQNNGNGKATEQPTDTLTAHRQEMTVFQAQLQAVLMGAPKTSTVPEIVGVLTFFAHNMTINARLMQEQMAQHQQMQQQSSLIIPR